MFTPGPRALRSGVFARRGEMSPGESCRHTEWITPDRSGFRSRIGTIVSTDRFMRGNIILHREHVELIGPTGWRAGPRPFEAKPWE